MGGQTDRQQFKKETLALLLLLCRAKHCVQPRMVENSIFIHYETGYNITIRMYNIISSGREVKAVCATPLSPL